MTRKKKKSKSWKKILFWGLILFIIYLLFEFLTLPNVGYLKTQNPSKTALMNQRIWEHRWRFKPYKIYQVWVPYSKISPVLRHAVLIDEDASFFSHDGFDYEEIEKAIKEDWEKKSFARGASTITQQLAKNLFLSTSKNPIRKIQEVILTRRLEKDLTKRRIFELYLNEIEWGDGIFGCEAASRAYFGKSCSELTPMEAAMLSAAIPNPLYANPKTNTRTFRWRTNLIFNRMKSLGWA